MQSLLDNSAKKPTAYNVFVIRSDSVGTLRSHYFKESKYRPDLMLKIPTDCRTAYDITCRMMYGSDLEYDLCHPQCINAGSIKKVFEFLEKLPHTSDDKNFPGSKDFKFVWEQHGGDDGRWQDLNIKIKHAAKMINILHSKGYRNIHISDGACHGATGNIFLEAIEQNAHEWQDLNIKIKHADKKSTVQNFTICDTNIKTTVAIDALGDYSKRNITLFDGKCVTKVQGQKLDDVKNVNTTQKMLW